MSINNLRESPIPPHPEGWGLLGQRVEHEKFLGKRSIRDLVMGNGEDVNERRR